MFRFRIQPVRTANHAVPRFGHPHACIKPNLDWNEGYIAEGVYFDAEFPRDAQHRTMSLTEILPARSQPLNVLAVDAPYMRRVDVYGRHALHTLACKIILIHAIATRMRCPVVFTGFLGVDKLCNNRP